MNLKDLQIILDLVVGDGSDWNLTELRLLGDISVAVPVLFTIMITENTIIPSSTSHLFRECWFLLH